MRHTNLPLLAKLLPLCCLAIAACGGEGNTATGSGGGSGGAGASGGTGGSGGPPVPVACASGMEAPLGFFVATDGTPDGDGSLEKPWDLPTALAGPPAVTSGDTIWLRGGHYAGAFVSKLVGADGAPITVRSYPGEWAVLDGAGNTDPVLQIYKSFTSFRDVEITNGDPNRSVARPSGIYVEGDHISLVDLVVHEVGTGIICNSADDVLPELAPELEVNGTILYNNGWQEPDRAHGHHLYLQNRDGMKHIIGNVIFNAFGFGVHAYSDNDAHWAQGYDFVGNIWFGSGAAAPGLSKHYDDCMVGHNGTHPVARLSVRDNFGWATTPDERNVRLGWSAANEDVEMTGNYIVGSTIFQPSWNSVVLSGNTLVGPVEGIDTTQYADNVYQAAPNAETKVFVRKSTRTEGRGLVIVYNEAGADSVDVDLGEILTKGAIFEARSAEDILGASVVSGTYEGVTVSFPLNGLPVAQPVGIPDAILPEETPGKRFKVFVVTGCTGASGM